MNPGTLLIVDDEKDLVSILCDLLKDQVAKIVVAYNGEEGLAMLKAHEVDCVLSDIKMPKMDGVQFIKAAREVGHKMPFIFYTAHGNRDLMLEVVNYEVFDFLSKPNLVSLEESVHNALSYGVGLKTNKVKSASDDEISSLLNSLNDTPTNKK